MQRVAVVLSPELGFDREAMFGIAEYAGPRRPWLLDFIPMHSATQIVTALRRVRPDGLVARVPSAALATKLRRLRRPIVNISGIAERLPVPRVAPDNRAVGRLAADHLVGKGVRDFVILRHGRHDNSRRRAEGFTSRLAESGRRATVRLAPARLESLATLLGELPPACGVYADSDRLALRVTEAARLAGVAIPESLCLVSNDNDELLCRFARPTISSIDLNARRVGYEAAALLDRLMAGRTAPRQATLLPPGGVVQRRSSDAFVVPDRDVAAALRLIFQRAGGVLRVGDVAAGVHLSRRGLERRFASVLGRSVHDEICRVRFERARMLLSTTDLPVPQVARESGYGDARHFATAFRAAHGRTPRDHRRQYRHAAGDQDNVGNPTRSGWTRVRSVSA